MAGTSSASRDLDIACSPQYPVQGGSPRPDPAALGSRSLVDGRIALRAAEFDTCAAEAEGQHIIGGSTVGAAAARRQDPCRAMIGADSVALAAEACDQPNSSMASAFPVASAVAITWGGYWPGESKAAATMATGYRLSIARDRQYSAG